MTEKLIKSKQRVKDFAEVFTPKHIVKDMCDLVPEEMWVNVETTFLEPACGTADSRTDRSGQNGGFHIKRGCCMTCSHCGKTAEQNNNWVLCPYYKYAPVCMTHCYSDCKRFDMAVGKCIYTLRKAERNGKK
jgi:hypothetical protein